MSVERGEIKTSKEQIGENKPIGEIYKMSRNLEERLRLSGTPT
jgi:hypothetical protein